MAEIEPTAHIGRRLRELRAWRGMNLETTAGLAGISYGYLGKIERGDKPVERRQTLEALASALRVAPTELTGLPYAVAETGTPESHAVITPVEEALTECELGEAPEGVSPRPWPQIQEDVRRLTGELFLEGDYAAQGALLAPLLFELHATYAATPGRDVLVALIECYHRATALTKNLGIRGLPSLAAHHARSVADELDEPRWHALAAYLRGYAAGSSGRARQYGLSIRAADELRPHLDEPDSAQMYGMLHLNAALAMATQARKTDAEEHLGEATAMAKRMDPEVGDFAGLFFGRANVGVWRVGIATELGESDRVGALAQDAQPEAIPSKVRQAMFWADLGRALAPQRATRESGIQALVRAEEIAPQRVRNNLFVREMVSHLLTKARRDAGGRELRGLAWRMGVAPTG